MLVLLTKREVADHLRVSVRTIDRLLAHGTLHAVLPEGARRVLIAVAEVDNYLPSGYHRPAIVPSSLVRQTAPSCPPTRAPGSPGAGRRLMPWETDQ